MNQVLKVIERLDNCTLLNDLFLKSEGFCIKTVLANAIIGRKKRKITQLEASKRLGVSKRTVVLLEKGEVDKLSLIFKYIQLYAYDFPLENKRRAFRKMKSRL